NLAQGYGNQQAGAWGNATNQFVNQDNTLAGQQLAAVNQGDLAGQQANATLLNTLFGLGGLALKGAAPTGQYGTGPSAFGNIASGIGGVGSSLGSGLSSLLGGGSSAGSG